jgi:hypothetical protein
VSYDYQTQKVAYTVWDQSINTNWVLFRYYSLFAGYRDAPAKLVSGTPLFPLNSIKYYYYGGRLDVPFWDDAMVGGEARYEDQQDDVAPYNRQSFDAYVQLPVPYTSTTVFRVSGKRVIGDNIGSPEDVDLKGWGARLTSRLAYRGLLTAETNYYEDTGGTQFRRNRDTRLAAEWRIRQLTLTAEGRRTLETLGNYETERNILRALARRDF